MHWNKACATSYSERFGACLSLCFLLQLWAGLRCAFDLEVAACALQLLLMIVRTLSDTVALALGFNVDQVFFGRSPLLGVLRAAAASALPRS